MPPERTNVLITRMGIWFLGKLAEEDWLARRLEFARAIGQPAYEKLETPWHWVWVTAAERYEQVLAEAPDYVTVVKQNLYPNDEDQVFLATESNLIPGERFLVARLDSDDAFLPAALDWAASQRWQPDTLLNFPNGWRWYKNEDTIHEVNIMEDYQGHYLAVTQESRDRMFDMGGVHMRARRGRTMVTYPARSYLQFIHGENLTPRSKERKKRVLSPLPQERADEVLAKFGVKVKDIR